MMASRMSAKAWVRARGAGSGRRYVGNITLAACSIGFVRHGTALVCHQQLDPIDFEMCAGFAFASGNWGARAVWLWVYIHE